MELKIENLEVTLQKNKILNKVSLTVKSGELISLLGASGCGKSTMLKSIAGLLDIEKGRICLDGKEIHNMAPEKRGTVIVFQDLRLFPHMTVEKNIAFPMELKKMPKTRQKEIIKKLLEDVQLPGFEKRKIKEMSGGQMQRVALARALACEPSILLLDEPFSGLDEKLRLEMGALVKKLQKERKITTILVTHDKKEAMQMSDRIALMSNGHILQYASPTEIFQHPENRQVAAYFGKANYIEGTVQKEQFDNDYISCEAKGYADGKYELLVRPFDVKVIAGGSAVEIREMTYLGETVDLYLRDEKQIFYAQDISARIHAAGLMEGAKAGIEFAPESICLFPEEKE